MTATETVRIAKEYANSPHLRPRGDNIVLVPIHEEREIYTTEDGKEFSVRISEGGVALPDIVEQEPIEGRVVALGTGEREYLSRDLAHRLALISLEREGHNAVGAAMRAEFLAAEFMNEANKPRPFEVEIGKRYLFIPWECTTVVLDEIEFFLCSERAIMGIVDEVTSEPRSLASESR